MTGSVFSPDYEPTMFQNEWAFPGIMANRLESPAGSVFSPDYEPELFRREWSYPYISNMQPVNPNWPAANPPAGYTSKVEEAVKQPASPQVLPEPPAHPPFGFQNGHPMKKFIPLLLVAVGGVLIYTLFIKKKE